MGHKIAKTVSETAHVSASILHKVDSTARNITAPITNATGIDLYDFTPMGVVTSLGEDVIDESGTAVELTDKYASGKKVSNRELNNLGGRIIKSGSDYSIHRISGVLGGKVGSKLAKNVSGKMTKSILKSFVGKVAGQKIGQNLSDNIKRN